jgi:uncharacterized protein (DUF1330 family)
MKKEWIMNMKFKFVLTAIAGAALGAAGMQGLHAQAKAQAYSIAETEAIDASANAAYAQAVRAAIKAAGGRSFNIAGGKVVTILGAAPPKLLAITEWDSLEKAQAFYNSSPFTSLAPQREKAQKIIRIYAVEAVQ